LEGAKINTLDYSHEFSLYPQSLQINVAKYKKYLALCQMLKVACDLHCTSMSDYSWQVAIMQPNPLSPSINIHILLTVVHIFLLVWVGRICTNIETFCVGWSFLLFSWPVCLIKYWYCKEKLDACHCWSLKG